MGSGVCLPAHKNSDTSARRRGTMLGPDNPNSQYWTAAALRRFHQTAGLTSPANAQRGINDTLHEQEQRSQRWTWYMYHVSKWFAHKLIFGAPEPLVLR